MTTRQVLALAGVTEAGLPCVRGHARWRRHREGCVDEACSGCVPAEASVGLLCAGCFRRVEDLLELIPELVQHAASSIIPIGSFQYDRVRVDSSSGTDVPLPFNVDVIDALNELWGSLVVWSVSFADRLLIRPPVPVTAAVRARAEQGLEGLPAGVTVASAYAEFAALVAWFRSNGRDIASTGLAGQWVDVLTESVKLLRGRWPVQAQPQRVRCAMCILPSWHEVKYSKPRAPWMPEPFLTDCPNCGHVPGMAVEDAVLLRESDSDRLAADVVEREVKAS